MKSPSEKKDQLAVKESSPLAPILEMPEHLRTQQNDHLGSENVDQGDIAVPRMAICQSNTPQRKKSDPKYIEGLEEGDYFNTVTRENYGKEVLVIPVFFFKSRILWEGEKGEIGKGIKCASPDAVEGTGDPGGSCKKCPHSAFGEDCNLFANNACLVMDASGNVDLAKIITVPMKSVGLGTAKKWNGLINIKNKNRFSFIYKLTTYEDKRESGTSWQPDVRDYGWASDKLYALGKQAYELISELQNMGKNFIDAEAKDVAGDQVDGEVVDGTVV